MGHSMGGGGAMSAALRRPSLKAAVGLAPFSPSQTLNNPRVPTMQVWNGTVSTSGASVSARNVSYNGSLPPSGSTTFVFIGSGTPANPTLTCV